MKMSRILLKNLIPRKNNSNSFLHNSRIKSIFATLFLQEHVVWHIARSWTSFFFHLQSKWREPSSIRSLFNVIRVFATTCIHYSACKHQIISKILEVILFPLTQMLCICLDDWNETDKFINFRLKWLFSVH